MTVILELLLISLTMVLTFNYHCYEKESLS